jgi:predicted nucleic acid-binding protein
VIVVNASAITAFFLREEGWSRLAQHVRRAVPVDHIVKGFYNAIWRALAIRKLISHEHAKKVLQLFKEYVEKSLVLDILDPNPTVLAILKARLLIVYTKL